MLHLTSDTSAEDGPIELVVAMRQGVRNSVAGSK